MSGRWRALSSGALLLAAYGGLVAWLTWPLSAHLATHLPAVFPSLNCDRHLSAWALSWSSRALASSPWAIADANVYHPTPRALFYGQAGFGALPYFAPVFLLTGNPTLALNVTLLAGLATTAWLLHLVVRWWTGSTLAGFVAAATFLANRFVFRYVPTAPHLAALELLPLIAYMASRPHERLRAALALVPLIVLQSLTETAYVAPAVFAPLGTLALIRLLRPATRAAGARLVVALAAAAVVLAPVYLEYRAVIVENPDLQTVWTKTSVLRWSLGTFVGQGLPNQVPMVVVLLVVVGMVLACTSRAERAEAARRRAWATGLLWFVVGATLSIGPTLTIGSHVLRTPMSYAAEIVPQLQRIRVPVRSGFGALTGTAILAGVAFAAIADRRRAGQRGMLEAAMRTTLALLVGAALYFNAGVSNKPPSRWSVYAPPLPPPRLVRILREAPGPVVEIPPGPSDDLLWPVTHAAAMYRSIYHRQPILNGYRSYYPRDFAHRMALAARMPERRAVTELRAEAGLRYVWLHANRVPPARLAVWKAYDRTDDAPLHPVAREGFDWLYEVEPDSARR